MPQSLRQFTRDWHLYAGLFLSPFVLLFAFSAILLVHPRAPVAGTAGPTRNAAAVTLPAGLEQAKGREQVHAARSVLEQLGVSGEIWNIRQFPRERRLEITVNVPGRETVVNLNAVSGTATITRRDQGLAEALVYLHKTPGPHLVALRGNSSFMTAWRWVADAAVYLLLFLTLSGVYLWAVLRAERSIGLVLLAAGALSFGGILYALVS